MKDRTIVEEIKRKVTLKDVIAKFGGAELHGDGDKVTGWHTAHPSTSKNSLNVDNKEGKYLCFGCNEGGDIFEWVGHVRFNSTWNRNDNAMWGEVLGDLAAFAGVALPEYNAEKAAERKSIEDVWQLAADFYHGELTPEHREYFHKRGYTDETIDKYKLGYAPVGPRTLLAELVMVHKIDGAELAKSGLFLKRDNGNLEDHFQGRLMFPYWRNGRVAYFIGRITDDSPKWEHERGMKYKKLLVNNDKHSYVSEQVSNRYFYGEDSVKPGGDLLITEGVADCLSALQAGFACVSPVTIRFAKKDHAKILEIAERAGTVYICNDNEVSNAGGEGTLATAQMLWEHGKVAKLITLPRPAGVSKIDLNDYLVANSADEFKKLLPTAKTLLDLKVDEYAAAQTDEARIAAQRAVIDLASWVKEKFQLELWKRKLPKLLGLSAYAFCDMLKDAQQERAEKSSADEPVQLLSEVITKILTSEGFTSFRQNELDDSIEVNGVTISDGLAAEIRCAMRDKDFMNMDAVKDTYTRNAYRNAYHPIKDYLGSLTWDGEDTIGALACHFISKDTPVFYKDGSQKTVLHAFLIRFCVGAVAKVYEQAQNIMLTLAGPQGIGKSTVPAWLCSPLPDFYNESQLDPEGKETDRRLAKTFLWEIGELAATTRRAEVNALKNKLTQSHVTFRVPYGHYDVTKPVLTSFIGTVNPDGRGFLVDRTGNRRFAVVNVKSIDFGYFTGIDPNQVWAQAVTLYRAGEPWRLTPEETATQKTINAEHQAEDTIDMLMPRLFCTDLSREDWKMEPFKIAEELLFKNYAKDLDKCAKDAAAWLKANGHVKKGKPLTWRGIRIKTPADVAAEEEADAKADAEEAAAARGL